MSKLAIRRHLAAGILLILPIWLTWIVVRFLFNALASVSAPPLRAVGWPDRFRELVPLDRVEDSVMSMDEAMSFIISGGAVNPRRFRAADATPPQPCPPLPPEAGATRPVGADVTGPGGPSS
jgi:uncharacterized membrane protein